MIHPEEVVPNERLRRARILKGWSQAELAEQVVRQIDSRIVAQKERLGRSF